MVPSPNGAPKRTLPHAAPHAHDEVRRERAVAARRVGRLGCGSCACVSARARSADEYEPSWAHWLPQQPTQSRLKGSRQARAEQGHARGRDTGFEGSKPAAHLLKPSKTPNSLGDSRRKRTSNHPASWVASHQGRVRFMVRISAVRSRRHAVCKLISCCARVHCVARSQGLATTPQNGYARAVGNPVARGATQITSDHPSGAARKAPSISK